MSQRGGATHGRVSMPPGPPITVWWPDPASPLRDAVRRFSAVQIEADPAAFPLPPEVVVLEAVTHSPTEDASQADAAENAGPPDDARLRDAEDALARIATIRERVTAPTLWVVPTAVVGASLRLLGEEDDVCTAETASALLVHRLERLARAVRHRDPLTGVGTRPAFIERLKAALAMASDGAPVSVVVVDVDRLKAFNDTHGHEAGDRLLRGVAERITGLAPPPTFVARYSGERFSLLVPHGQAWSAKLGERITQAVRATPFPIDGASPRRAATTVSVGVATAEEVMTPRELLSHAEDAMYAAKAGGRDRCVVFGELERAAMEGDGDLMVQGFENLTRVIAERVADVITRRGRRLFRELREQADVDALTGLFSRRYLDRRLAFEVGEAHRTGEVLTLALLDLDHFGDVNKAHGWPTGDAVLREVANRIRESVRTDDWVARYGGEEICIVMHGTRIDDAQPVLERVRSAIADRPFTRAQDDGTFSLTASVGGAELAREESTAALLQRVSDRLLDAKGNGRNRVAV